MRLEEIRNLLAAENLTDQLSLDTDVDSVHASDLISEVLASCSRGALWLTGLLDVQVVNAAELFDLAGIVFVGNRRPYKELLDAANEDEIPILVTELTMFEACGLLFRNDLKSAKRDR